MWESRDCKNFFSSCARGVGQIHNDAFSTEIAKYAANPEYKTFLEIGTWNGMGSTRAFASGFMNRNNDYEFYSLECNRDKWMEASKLYSGNDKIHILNEVIWNEEPSDFYKIFPQCLSDATYKHWNEVDIINMKKCNLFLERPNLPNIFDVVLLDGGEFTTYYEFQILKNRCRILMLDDIGVDKCRLIVEEIRADKTWKIITENRSLRNGFLIAEKQFV
jgi:hypothetical protein